MTDNVIRYGDSYEIVDGLGDEDWFDKQGRCEEMSIGDPPTEFPGASEHEMSQPVVQEFRDSKNRTAREAWLAARRSMIGASESPAILGVGYASQSPWSVWESKVFGLPDKQPPLAFEIGLEMERVTATMLERVAGIHVNCQPQGYAITRHATFPWLGCSLDGTTTVDYETVPVELKNVGQHNAREWGACDRCGGDGCDLCGGTGSLTPVKYLVQVQHQMAVTQTSKAVLAALIGGQAIEYRIVPRDDEFIAALKDELKTFWRLVETRTPPAPDASEAARQAINRLYPTAEPGYCVQLPDDMRIWAQRLEAAKQLQKDVKEQIAKAEANLKLAIGEAEYGALSDGRYVKWSRSPIKATTVERQAYTRHTLSVKDKLPRGVRHGDSTETADTAGTGP